MSKSVGNIISPQRIIKDKGADILRMWVAMTDYTKEMTISEEIIKRVSESYRRIRNTSKFLLSNINDFDVNEFNQSNLLALDKWIIHKAEEMNKQIQSDYEEFRFNKIMKDVINFCTLELGGYYLDIIKDRLYTSKSDGIPRCSAQMTCYVLMRYINSWIAPILTFTAEEIYSKIPNCKESIYLDDWFSYSLDIDDKSVELFDSLYEIKSDVSRLIEEARNNEVVGSSLECKIEMICNNKLYEKLKPLEGELKFIFIVSEFYLIMGEDNDNYVLDRNDEKLRINVLKSDNKKCERCWHLNETVGTINDAPTICQRCHDNVHGDGECRIYA